MTKKLILSLSGGMDSTTLLGVALNQGYEVYMIHFQYGSKHNPYEEKAVEAIRYHYMKRSPRPLHFHPVDLTPILENVRSDLLRSGGPIPEGHYQAANMSRTVVPGRNLLFISVMASMAESLEIPEVWIGAHSGDHVIYPDCRPDFIHAANQVVKFSTDNRVSVTAPYLYKDKTQLIADGLPLAVPYHLTRTCYKDQPISCGRCGACQERLEAFANNQTADPIEYQTRDILTK